MIVVDPLRQWDHGLGPRMGPSCHMCSTLHGEVGTEELVAFAMKIGMRRSWLQHPGTEHEHFDLFGARRARAVSAGAVEITARALAADVWAVKRARLQVVYAVRAQEDARKAYALARDVYGSRVHPVQSKNHDDMSSAQIIRHAAACLKAQTSF